MEVWESKPPGTLWATPGLLRAPLTVRIVSELRYGRPRALIRFLTLAGYFSLPQSDQTESGGPNNLLLEGHRVGPSGVNRQIREADYFPPSSAVNSRLGMSGAIPRIPHRHA